MLLLLDNEPDPEKRYHVEALRDHLPEHEVYAYTKKGGQPDLDGVDGVVISGSTAGVYEDDDHPWIRDQRAFVRRLVDEEMPTLGVCFGHQIVNDALGGTVEHRGMRAGFVETDLADDPLFDGVESVVPAVHGDYVTELGEGMEPIGSEPDYPLFASRHETAPVRTVQYHPEFTADLENYLTEQFDWDGSGHSFEDCTADRTYRNFERLVADGA